jgi:hypothetical protein
VGSILLKETHATRIWDELDNPPTAAAPASSN